MTFGFVNKQQFPTPCSQYTNPNQNRQNMKHIIKIRLLLLMLLLTCLCHTPTMAYTQPTLSAAAMAGTDDENTEDDTGGTGDNTGDDTGGDTGEDPGTTLPTNREPADVAQYIWWIDDDFEHRTTVTLTASNAVSSSIKDVDVSQLKAGLHTVYVMAADIYGRWGQINPFLFFIPQTTDEREAALNVTYCEYWFDDDFDNRKTATVKGTVINLEQESIAALAPGTHYLRYRVMNDQGVFSSTISHQFLVQGTPDVIADVEYCEAWIDEDYANRQQVTLNGTQGTIDFDTEALRPGLHTVYTHARNTNKRWGQVNSFVFFKPQPEETLPNATSITRWEYWFDDNFDQRKVSTASGTSFTLPEADKSLADFSRGIHYFYYRALNNEGVWSPVRRHLFYYSGKDESGSSPLTGYRYVFNGQSYKGNINNESTYTFNKTITIPAVQTMPIEKDSCQFTFTTVNDKDTVRMQRNVGYLFAIQFKNKLGAWSNPIDTTFVMSQKDSVEVKPLAMESTVTFDRPEAGLYCPFKMTLSKRGTFFLTPSEKCHILLFDADGNEQEEITPDDFSDGLSLGKYFETGTYYGIIYNLVGDNTSLPLSLKLGLADKVTPAPDIDFDDDSKTVTITNTLDPDVQTYYTLDGNDPTTTPSETCMQYGAPFTVDRNCTVKAISKAEGYDASIIATCEVDAFKVATPTYSVDIATATVRLNCSESGARIYYILNPNEDDDPANGAAYPAEGLPFTNDMDIAFCAKKDYFNNSESVRAQIIRSDYTCGEPVFVPDVNKDTYTDKAYGVTITSNTPDAVILYTTDDTDPLTSGTKYTGKITVDGNCTLKAVATKDGKFANANELEISNFKVSAPKMEGVDVVNGTTGYVKLSCTTTGAQLWYNLDGVSYQYVETGIPFTNDINDLKVYATKADFITSTEVPLDIKKSYYQCEKPTVNQEMTEEGNYKLTVTTGTKDATVKYKVDNGSVETYNMATGIVVSKNCDVIVWAEKDNLFNSDEEKVTVGTFKVATPESDHVDVKDGKTGYLFLSCGTNDATIKYVRNGTTYVYNASTGISFEDDMNLQVYAEKTGYTQSQTVSITVKKADYQAKKPNFEPEIPKEIETWKSYKLTIKSEEEDATLRYKVINSEYGGTYQDYKDPVDMEVNCIVKAYAQVDNKFDSNEALYDVNNFKVTMPEFDKVEIADGKTAYVKLKCETPEATIYYYLNGANMSGQGAIYNPDKGIKFDGDEMTVIAYAKKSGYKDSDKNLQIEKILKSKYLLDAPVIKATKDADGKSYSVSITAEEGSVVWYTVNGNDPRSDTDNRKQYEGAFTVDRNCEINAYVTMIDKFDSELAKPVQIDGLSVGDIAFNFEASNNTLTISSEGALAIYYEIDNENVTEQSKKYDGPITLEENCKVYALAVCGADLDAMRGNYTVDEFACEEVTVEGYNGRYLRLTCHTADATIYYSIDGGEEQEYEGTGFDVQGLTKVTARVEKNKLKWHPNELKIPFTVPCYYAGDAVHVKEAGKLEKAFEWCGGFPADKTELTVIGNVNHNDLVFVKAKNWLQFLDMKEALVAEKSLPDEAFAGMSQLICITLPDNFTTVGSRLLKGDSRLGAVIWNSTAAVPADLFDNVVHANALIYVSSPAIAANAPLRNRVVNGMADEIVLSDASSVEGNFYCPIEFKAKMITYEHAYGMETETGIGKCRGWEAISLPFDVQKMIHYDEKRASLKDREILPFAADGNDDTPRFWLYSLNGEFTSASGIEANTPYIICMPNCKDYGDIYNLNGKVTFRSENVDVHPSQEIHEGVQKTYRFVPNTQYVAQCDTVMALNIYQDYQGNPEGSVFVKNWRAANPFEAYITSDDAEAMKAQMFRIDRYATAIDGWTAFAQRDIYSENGNLYINCQRDCVVRLYTTQGQLVRVLQLHAGLNEITGIARGIYLVNSVKIVVK